MITPHVQEALDAAYQYWNTGPSQKYQNSEGEFYMDKLPSVYATYAAMLEAIADTMPATDEAKRIYVLAYSAVCRAKDLNIVIPEHSRNTQ